MNATLPQSTEPDRRSEAAIAQLLWKSDEMKRMAVAVCDLALEKAGSEFSANDLPKFKHGGPGICGTAFTLLRDFNVIVRAEYAPGCPKFVFNKGANPVAVWRLAGEQGAKLARTLLKVHGVKVPEMKQEELV